MILLFFFCPLSRYYRVAHAILFYLLRPNIPTKEKISKTVQHIIPSTFDPSSSLGIPIRGTFLPPPLFSIVMIISSLSFGTNIIYFYFEYFILVVLTKLRTFIFLLFIIVFFLQMILEQSLRFRQVRERKYLFTI